MKIIKQFFKFYCMMVFCGCYCWRVPQMILKLIQHRKFLILRRLRDWTHYQIILHLPALKKFKVKFHRHQLAASSLKFSIQIPST